MGATATMLYGITLLLDPLPPETYKNQAPLAEQTKRRWGPSWRKPWGKKKRKGSDLDGAGSVKDVRHLPAPVIIHKSLYYVKLIICTSFLVKPLAVRDQTHILLESKLRARVPTGA